MLNFALVEDPKYFWFQKHFGCGVFTSKWISLATTNTYNISKTDEFWTTFACTCKFICEIRITAHTHLKVSTIITTRLRPTRRCSNSVSYNGPYQDTSASVHAQRKTFRQPELVPITPEQRYTIHLKTENYETEGENIHFHGRTRNKLMQIYASAYQFSTPRARLSETLASANFLNVINLSIRSRS